MNLDSKKHESFRIRTPDGSLTVFVVEKEDGSIDHFQLFIGKAGASVSAWSNGLCAMMNLAIKNGITLEQLIDTLSGITSDREARALGSTCHSGIEGVWMALIRYKRSKFSELGEKLGTSKSNHSKGPSVAAWAPMRDD